MKKHNIIEGPYWFELFIKSQETPYISSVVETLHYIFKRCLDEKYRLDILPADQFQDRIREENIQVVPTLIRQRPEPKVKISGDLTKVSKIIFEFNLPASSGEKEDWREMCYLAGAHTKTAMKMLQDALNMRGQLDKNKLDITRFS